MKPKIIGTEPSKFAGIINLSIDERIGQFDLTYVEKKSIDNIKTTFIRLMHRNVMIMDLIIHTNTLHIEDNEFVEAANRYIKDRDYSKLIMYCLFRYYNLDDLTDIVSALLEQGEKQGKRILRAEIRSLIDG